MVPLPPWSTIFRSKSAVGLNFLRSRISLFRSRTLMPFPTKFTLCCELSAPWCMRKLTEDAILGEESEVPSIAPSTSSSVGRKDSIVHISWKEAPYKLKWIPIELLQRHCAAALRDELICGDREHTYTNQTQTKENARTQNLCVLTNDSVRAA